jgi:hypothetical protein
MTQRDMLSYRSNLLDSHRLDTNSFQRMATDDAPNAPRVVHHHASLIVLHSVRALRSNSAQPIGDQM